MVISDVLLDGELPESVRQSVLAYVGCVAGAMRRDAYFGLVEAAGFQPVALLSDVDFLEKLGGEIPRDVQELLDAANVSADELAGKVRSVTFATSTSPRQP